MAINLWCEAAWPNDGCNFEHRGMCGGDPCVGVTHGFGGRRTLQARPAFDGPPERGGFSRPPDSMDAWKAALPWPDNRPTNRLFPNDDRVNAYDMHACYDAERFVDFPDCPHEPHCEIGPAEGPWRSNCGYRVEGGDSMHGRDCAIVGRPRCARLDKAVRFSGDAFTGRTAFIGSIGGPGGECLGVWNWVCFGDGNDGDGCVGGAEGRRWSPARMDWGGVRLTVPPQNDYSRPAIEHALARTVLGFVAGDASGFGIDHLERPGNNQMEQIDLWESVWPPLGQDVPCGELPVLAGLPGAQKRDSGDTVEADLVLFGVRAWMSLHFRKEDLYAPAGATPGIPDTSYHATAQIGLDIDCVARVAGLCGRPPVVDGERVVFEDDGKWYRPPYVVKWRGEATPMSEPEWFDLTAAVNRPSSGDVGGNPDLSNVGICRSLRTGMSGKRITRKSVAKGGGLIELYDGSASIVRIGD
jgi:hypothetical protein